MKKIKIMTFNTQHCLSFKKQKIDYDAMAKAIMMCEPDIAGLNEMRGKGEDAGYENQTEILAELAGMKHYYFAKAIDVNGENPYGNALISKYPPEYATTIPIPDPEIKNEDGYYETRCILKARVEGGITVMVTHFGLNSDEQKNAVACVLENMEEEKCILMGDFNVTPDNDILKPIREKMKDVADKSEFLSFPSDVPDRKIDYIFVTPDIKVLSYDIPEIIASDHRPHTAVIKL